MAISFLETIRKNKHKHNNKCVYDVNKDREWIYCFDTDYMYSYIKGANGRFKL